MKAGLENETNRHQQAQVELDTLYDSIFHGPTPDFPEEDDKENAQRVAFQNYHNCSVTTEAELNAVRRLEEAQRFMGQAINFMEEALSHSRMDMFGGGSMTDMMERNAVNNAERSFMEARMMVMQARNSSSSVKDLPQVKFAKGSLLGDVIFDNIFSDMAMHDELKRSRMEVGRCMNALEQGLAEAKGRHTTLSWDLKSKAEALNQARIDLQKAREAVFKRTTEEAPPAYA